jgi:DHA2 family multidrug resistance protein-like MFS transporter
VVTGLSPLGAGVAVAPGMATAVVSFQLAPLLARLARPAVLIAGGLIISAVGLLILGLASTDAGPAVLVIGFAVSCLGGGPLVSLGTGLIIGSAPAANAGAAPGLAQIGNALGCALGIAILSSIGTAVYRARLVSNLPAGTPRGAAVVSPSPMRWPPHAACLAGPAPLCWPPLSTPSPAGCTSLPSSAPWPW